METAVIVSVPGEVYESKKSEFKQLRSKFSLVHTIFNPEHHIWIDGIIGQGGESLDVFYSRDDFQELVTVRIQWDGPHITPLLEGIMKIFIGEI